MLKQRIISGVIGAAFLIAITLIGGILLRIAVGIVAFCMLYELFRATKVPLVLFIPSVLYTVAQAMDLVPVFFQNTVLAFYIVLTMLLLLILHDKLHTAKVGLACLFALFVGQFMGCLTRTYRVENGTYWIWLVYIGAWGSDIFAFTVGKLMGKHKLIPSVSPAKTLEGAVGGALGTAVCFLLFGLLVGQKIGEPNIAILFLSGIFVSICGQIGDLVASVIKRQYGIKDYGKIMPGHGGFMDRFDSILFVAPAVYFYLQYLL